MIHLPDPGSNSGQSPNTNFPPSNNTTPRRSRAGRILRRFLWGIGIFISVIILTLLTIAAFFDEQVTQRVVAEVNKNLKSNLVVGEASLSLLSDFPNAAVNLEQVRLKDAFGGQLLIAQTVSLRFDLTSLFGDNIKVHTLLIKNGALRVVVNRQGRANTDIFKESKAAKPTTESNLRLALENAELQNIGILYDNVQTSQGAELLVNQANVAGNFSAQQFELTSRADFKVARIDSDSSRYLAGETIKYDAALAVDLKKGLYDLQRVELMIGGNTFSVDGIAVSKPDFTDLNLKMVSQEGDISMLANLLPGAYHAYFREFQSSGNYSCSGTVKGRVSKTDVPAVSFEVALRDGKVSSDKLQSPLRNVTFQARYTTRVNGTGEFEVAGFKGDFGGQPLTLGLKITNLSDPVVDFQCNGALPLEATYGLFDNPAVSGGDGFLRLNALTVQGRYADMTSMRGITNVNATGEVQFDAARLIYNGAPVTLKTGFLRLQNNTFRADSLLLQVGKSDFALDGSAQNLLPVLFADSLNTSDALLEFSARSRSQNLDIDELLSLFTVQQTAVEVGQPALDSLKIEKNAARGLKMDKLHGTFEAIFANFKYGKIEGRNFNGRLAFNHNDLQIGGDVEAMQGKLHLDGEAVFIQKPLLKMRITAQNLDLTTMMAQCENFGQEVITDQNLQGKLSGRVAIWAYWDEKGNFDMNRLKAYADVQGRDGELVGLKMLEDFSTYIHVEDLRRIKFTNFQNYLAIDNQRLTLPAMFIQSNAVNLTLSGTHTFDNDINYKLKVNAGQVVMNRIKKNDNELDPLPAEKGWFNLYYTIIGNLDKYDMRRGKKAVKAEFDQSEARKRTIAAALDAEFNNVGIAVNANLNAGQKPINTAPEEYLDEIQGGDGN